MTSGCDDVCTSLVDIDRRLAHALDGIDQHERTGIVCDVGQRLDRQSSPVVPRERTDADEFRILDCCPIGVDIQPFRVTFDDPNVDPTSALEPLPGEDTGGVLEVCPDDNVVAPPLKRAGNTVDPVSRTLGQGDFAGIGSEEFCDGCSDIVVGIECSRLHAFGGRRFEFVVFEERLGGRDDSARTRTTRTGIEIDRIFESGNVRTEIEWSYAASASEPARTFAAVAIGSQTGLNGGAYARSRFSTSLTVRPA
jgi:hypothetical protein